MPPKSKLIECATTKSIGLKIERDVLVGIGTCKDKEVVIPDGVSIIERDAFKGCSSLTSVIIPNSVKSIRVGAFEDCTSLSSIDIPNGVTDICGYTFTGCTSLETITIPESIKNCSNLKKIKYNTTKENCANNLLNVFAMSYKIFYIKCTNGTVKVTNGKIKA